MGVQMGQGYKTLLSLFLLINVLFGKMNSLISFKTPQRKELAKNYTYILRNKAQKCLKMARFQHNCRYK